MRCICFCLGSLILLSSCKKFLTQKPDSTTYSASTLTDFRQMLDANAMVVNSTPGFGVLASDGYCITTTGWASIGPVVQGAATWDPSLYQVALAARSWSNPYSAINICNQVLEGLNNLPPSDRQPADEYNMLYGSALFYRSFYLYQLEETYGELYDPTNPGAALGVPLRLSADISQVVRRSSADSVYKQILRDCQSASPLLPPGVQAFHNRPGQPALWALLTKLAMTMQNYPLALKYADSCIGQYSTLLSYDSLQPALTGGFPFPDSLNTEILFQTSAVDYAARWLQQMTIDSAFYASYSTDDLRRSLYFKPSTRSSRVYYSGSYTGNHYFFSGLALDETILYRAECRARTGDLTGALDDLNNLLSHRYAGKTFQPYQEMTSTELILLILREEKKEMIFREGRWADLRRRNFDPIGKDSLVRIAAGTRYTLAPLATGYTFLIPQSEIDADGGPQNP